MALNFGKIGDMMGMLKQAKKMKSEMEALEEELRHKTVEAGSGGGAVKAVVNGRQELVGLKIEPQLVSDGDVEMLEDLVKAAVNAASQKAQGMVREEMGKITEGMDLPDIGSLLEGGE